VEEEAAADGKAPTKLAIGVEGGFNTGFYLEPQRALIATMARVKAKNRRQSGVEHLRPQPVASRSLRTAPACFAPFCSAEGPKTMTVKEHALVVLPSREEVALPCPDLPELVINVVDAIIVRRGGWQDGGGAWSWC
jgi:hypothetical protein